MFGIFKKGHFRDSFTQKYLKIKLFGKGALFYQILSICICISIYIYISIYLYIYIYIPISIYLSIYLSIQWKIVKLVPVWFQPNLLEIRVFRMAVDFSPVCSKNDQEQGGLNHQWMRAQRQNSGQFSNLEDFKFWYWTN